MTREELDRLILSIPRAKVTDKNERLDFPSRLPVCFGDENSQECYCCLHYKLMTYSLKVTKEIDDLVVFGCTETRLFIQEKGPYYQLFLSSVDLWEPEVYDEVLPLIIKLYDPEFIHGMFKLYTARLNKINSAR